MATYQQIIDKINAITDNGNNTAAEVRSVLTDMLNFSDTLKPFEIGSPDLVVSPEMTYHYSFRGIEKNICNLYLLFNLKEKTLATDAGGLTQLNIEITKEEYEVLINFIPTWVYVSGKITLSTYLAFTAPTLPVGMIRYINLVLYKIFENHYIVITTSVAIGETITTSLAINFKNFKMPTVVRATETNTMFSEKSIFNMNPDLFK